MASPSPSKPWPAITACGYDAGSFGIGRLTAISDSAGSSSWTCDGWGQVLIRARSIGYDAKGRITQACDWQMQRSFSYDAVDRLTGDTRGAQSWSWTCDANGNRQSQSTPQGASAITYLGNRIKALPDTAPVLSASTPQAT